MQYPCLIVFTRGIIVNIFCEVHLFEKLLWPKMRVLFFFYEVIFPWRAIFSSVGKFVWLLCSVPGKIVLKTSLTNDHDKMEHCDPEITMICPPLVLITRKLIRTNTLIRNVLKMTHYCYSSSVSFIWDIQCIFTL